MVSCWIFKLLFFLLCCYPGHVLVSLLGDSVLVVDLPLRQVWTGLGVAGQRKIALPVTFVTTPIPTPCFDCSNSSLWKIYFVETRIDAVPVAFLTLPSQTANETPAEQTEQGQGEAWHPEGV